MSLFTWSNDQIAHLSLTPRRYLVVVPQTATGQEIGRWRLPTVQWTPNLPIDEQSPRRWAEVAAEFADVFAPALAEDDTTLRRTLDADITGHRYQLETPLLTAVRQVFPGARARAGRYQHAGHTITVNGRELTLIGPTGESRLALTEATTEDDIARWLASARDA